MQSSRRSLLTAIAGAAGVMLVKPLLSFSQYRPTPQPLPSPNAPDPYDPLGLDGRPPMDDKMKQRQIDLENQKQLREEVHQLYKLASEMKTKVDTVNEATTFDVTVVHDAKAIEKLAKKIKSLAKG
jgi:hypothetical protein